MGNQSSNRPDEHVTGLVNPANRGLGAMDADGTRDAAVDQSKGQGRRLERQCRKKRASIPNL